jgi:predicted phosphodiesterase
MKICVISDLHCKFQLKIEENSSTSLISNKPRIPINQHPVAAFVDLVKRKNITADILICPGDLGDRADEQGIGTAWTLLDEMNRVLGSKLLLTIPGNHDVNSRKLLGKEPFAYIKSFHESFPFANTQLKNSFWEQGYCIIPSQDTLFLLINTVHDHIDLEKSKKATLTIETLESIGNCLREINLDNYKYKLCVLHHHPIKHSNINNYTDSDSVENGDRLIAILKHSNFNLVIHGHKHQPRLVEYLSLSILAAGCFSSFENLQGTGINTMFHLIDFDTNPNMGRVHSWEFNITSGWTQNQNKMFPPETGFGSNIDIDHLASGINSMFLANGNRTILFDDIVSTYKDIQFIVPDKLIQLNTILNQRYQLSTAPEFPLRPSLVTQIIS